MTSFYNFLNESRDDIIDLVILKLNKLGFRKFDTKLFRNSEGNMAFEENDLKVNVITDIDNYKSIIKYDNNEYKFNGIEWK